MSEVTAAIKMSATDLAAETPNDRKRRVSSVVVQAIMAAPAGVRIDRAKLQDLIEANYESLMSEGRFDFGPVLEALLRVEGVTEQDVYIGVVNLVAQLSRMDVRMEEPVMSLDRIDKMRLLEEAHEQTTESRAAQREAHLRDAIAELRRRKLGDLLVEEGLISPKRLKAVLEAQKKYGGRLGTNLVERGYLSESELAHFLSVQLGVPCVSRLDNLPSDAVEALPGHLAAQYRVVPTRIDGAEIHLAMADPLDLEAIDEVSYVTGLRVYPVVAPELLVAYALDRYYGIKRTQRVHQPQLPGPAIAEPPGRMQWAANDTVDFQDTMSLEEEDEEELPLNLSHLAHELISSEDDFEVYGALQKFMAAAFDTSAILLVDEGYVRGWSHRGALIRIERFRNSSCRIEEHPVLKEMTSSTTIYEGPGSEQTGSEWLTSCLGLPAEAHLMGVAIHGHSGPRALLVGHLPNYLKDPEAPQLDSRVQRMAQATLQIVSLRHRILQEVA